MSLSLVLYVNSSENNKLDKSLTTKGSYTFTFKDESSVFNPQVLISSGTSLSDVNYAYISDLGRYYYVTEIILVRTDLYLFKLHTDVLMTWKSQIRGCSAVCKRQENANNVYLDDPEFKVYNYKEIDCYNFTSPFSKNLEFLLTVAGD